MRRAILWVDDNIGPLVFAFGVWLEVSLIPVGLGENYWHVQVVVWIVVAALALLIALIWAACVAWGQLVTWAKNEPSRAPQNLPAPDPFVEAAEREVETILGERAA